MGEVHVLEGEAIAARAHLAKAAADPGEQTQQALVSGPDAVDLEEFFEVLNLPEEQLLDVGGSGAELFHHHGGEALDFHRA